MDGALCFRERAKRASATRLGRAAVGLEEAWQALQTEEAPSFRSIAAWIAGVAAASPLLPLICA